MPVAPQVLLFAAAPVGCTAMVAPAAPWSGSGALRGTAAARVHSHGVAQGHDFIAPTSFRRWPQPPHSSTRLSAPARARGPIRLGRRSSDSDRDADLARFAVPERRFPGAVVLALVRAVSLAVWLYGTGIVFFSAILCSLPFVKRRDPVRRRFIDRILAMWSRFVLFPFFRVRVEGKENLPPDDQACVYVANHQSFMDILSCYRLNRGFKFVSKFEILKIPVIGWSMQATDTVTIKREDKRSQLEAFRECVNKLKGGASLFVYPEGTRSKDGALIDFKKGPFAMARRAKTAVVPITILGTGRVMQSKKEYLLYPSSPGVRLVVHPPVSAEEVQAAENDGELLERVRGVIESALPPSCRRQA